MNEHDRFQYSVYANSKLLEVNLRFLRRIHKEQETPEEEELWEEIDKHLNNLIQSSKHK